MSWKLDSGMGYREEQCCVPALFYAGDGLLLVRSCIEEEDMIGVVLEAVGRCGLKINKGKRVMYCKLRSVFKNRLG